MSKYNIAIDEGGRSTVTMVREGMVVQITDDHPNFRQIADMVIKGEDPSHLVNLSDQIESIDNRVGVLHGVVYFDGEPVHNTLTRTILRYKEEGRDTTGLVRFMERLAENPSRRSREQLFDWVNNRKLEINDKGLFLAFKGVTDEFQSVHSGYAIVDGQEMNGNVPNQPGSVIEMPRELVQDDPNLGCSYGLHVGTWDYAKDFGTQTVEVAVDPADVVSVPSDSGHQKLRCCRYVVLAIHETEEPDVPDFEPEADYEEWEDELEETLEPIVPRRFLSRLFRKS